MKGFNDVLMAEYGRCPPGCSACEEACGRRAGDGKARIQPVSVPEVNFYGVARCIQCSMPACALVCPTKAITRSNGVVRIAEERCVGCALCTLACPYAGIFYDPGSKKAYKCEMCDQEIDCVEACEHGILSLGQSRLIRQHLGEDLLAPGVPLCQGCSMELSVRLAMRVFGRETLIFTGPGCVAPAIAAVYQGGFLHVPTFVCCMTNMPAIMTGVKRHFRNVGKDVTCVGFAGDGMTADIGFQSLSGAAERGENLIYICLDNEAYMNTGIQRSGTTPLFSWTSTTPIGEKGRGKQREPKNVPLLMAFHGVPYVATATVAFPEDYVQKLLKAKAVKDGMAYVHVLTPCPTGWRTSASQAIELSKLAVETGYFPLWEAENGKFNFTYRAKELRPLKEFTGLTGRFAHLTQKELKVLTKVMRSRLRLIEHLAEGGKTIEEN